MTTTSTPAAIEVEALSKRYRRRTAVDSVSFQVPEGVVCGLVGPNGAGKTTVMSMLLGLVRPTSGQARVLGSDIASPQAYLGSVGALIETPAFHGGLTGSENLRMLAELVGKPGEDIDNLLETVGLQERGSDKFRTYSLGMKQRLGIAASLIGDPKLVVLDEPTNGVDPQGMRDVRAMIRQIAEGGRTVLVSSHLLAELEAVCDHLVVLDRGGCRFAGPVNELSGGPTRVVVAGAVPADDLADILTDAGLTVTGVYPDRVLVEAVVGDVESTCAQANRAAFERGVVLTQIQVTESSLEDRVLELVSAGAA
ncbi:ABC transporter ATP-binding protein [Dermacoccaceae bacterium W4C1]